MTIDNPSDKDTLYDQFIARFRDMSMTGRSQTYQVDTIGDLAVLFFHYGRLFAFCDIAGQTIEMDRTAVTDIMLLSLIEKLREQRNLELDWTVNRVHSRQSFRDAFDVWFDGLLDQLLALPE